MKRAALQFSADMLAGRDPYWLSLLGSSGAGKTMLARLIANEVFKRHLEGGIYDQTAAYERRRRGGFVSWGRLVTLLRQGEYRVFDDLSTDWFIVIDDVGVEHSSPFIMAKLYEFLARRERKWTLITANMTCEEVRDRIDGRVASRMKRHQSTVVEVDVTDWADRQL